MINITKEGKKDGVNRKAKDEYRSGRWSEDEMDKKVNKHT